MNFEIEVIARTKWQCISISSENLNYELFVYKKKIYYFKRTHIVGKINVIKHNSALSTLQTSFFKCLQSISISKNDPPNST